MRTTILTAMLMAALAAQASAATYPVSGRWGESADRTQGKIDCAGKRVIAFSGEQHTDTEGGVRDFRNRSVTADGPSQYRIVDEFSNGLISDGHISYTLRQIDADHIVLRFQSGGGSVKLQRCK